ncbi:helix-turn-helix domain-containing protein [Leeuwenhoekiella marinoflava]|uniref:TetR/AcrR family transcriptional regulator n=1 Tax=Leeuwenhoekiella marinoflava TaxID=988 RepID=UPI003001152B|tara:strand:- start:6467 stop:7054 length:588 start_codon:yes stop_codon:yes gene_type:complete
MNSKDEIVRAQIIESARSVFKRYGYQKVSMDDIAKACGKGRSTLYYYFQNKKEVLEEVALEEYMTIIEPASKLVNASKTISENLLDYNSLKLKALNKKKEEYDHLFNDIKENPDFLHRISLIIRNKEMEMIKKCLGWAMDKKEIKNISNEDLDFLALAMVTAARSMEMEMLLYGSMDDMGNRLPWLINLLIKGLK